MTRNLEFKHISGLIFGKLIGCTLPYSWSFFLYFQFNTRNTFFQSKGKQAGKHLAKKLK